MGYARTVRHMKRSPLRPILPRNLRRTKVLSTSKGMPSNDVHGPQCAGTVKQEMEWKGKCNEPPASTRGKEPVEAKIQGCNAYQA